MIRAIDVARSLGDRMNERKAQRLLAAEYRPHSAWGVVNETIRVAAVELRIRAERASWIPDQPLTTLEDIGLTPYRGSWKALVPRSRAEDNLLLFLSLGEVAPSHPQARYAFFKAATLSDDPIVDAYSVTHGAWYSPQFVGELRPAREALQRMADVPVRLAEEVDHLLAAKLADQGEATMEGADAEFLRRLLVAWHSQLSGNTPVDAARELAARDPNGVRTPMLLWEIARATREPADIAALYSRAGPGSEWWNTADAASRAAVERLLSRARTRLEYPEASKTR